MDDELEGHHQERGDNDDGELVGRDDEVADGEVFRGKHGREGAGRRAEEDLAAVFEEERDADGGDEDVEGGAAPQRAIDEALDDNAEEGAAEHGNGEHDQAAPDRGLGDALADVVADERADHEHIGVREVDEPEHAIDHRIAEGDEGVDGAEGEAV